MLAIVDPTLWNPTFSGQAGVSRSSYSFSLSHFSSDCEMLLNSLGKQTSTQGCPPQNNYPPKVTYGKPPTSQNQPLPSRLPVTMPSVCYSYNVVLNQDVCIPIADMSTLATGAITTLKSPTSVIKPSFAPIGPGLYIDSTQLYTDNENGIVNQLTMHHMISIFLSCTYTPMIDFFLFYL